MRIIHVSTAGRRIVDVDIDDPTRTVADLLAALRPGVDGVGDLVIDGDRVTIDTPLSAVALCEGSVVDSTAEPATTSVPVRTLAVVGGVRAGIAYDAARPIVIGRAPDVGASLGDPALSGRHLRIGDGEVRDLGSHNGTAIEGRRLEGAALLPNGWLIRAGVSRFCCGPAIDDRPLSVVHGLGARGGTIPFNRPPRAPTCGPAAEVACPAPRPSPPSAESLSVAGIVLPIIAGAVVAVLFSPYMAIFAALGPVLTVGTWWERRRRGRRDHRRALDAFDTALGVMRDRLPEDREREIVRRRTLHCDPAEIVRRASAPSVRLWERRIGDADAFRVAVGAADESFVPALAPNESVVPAGEALALVAALPAMPDVPLEVDLSPGRVLGLLGDRVARISIARALVLQMATHHGPADLSIAVGADDPSAWAWTTWLPHTADHASGRRGVGLLETGDVPGALGILTSIGDRAVLAVLDGDDPFQGRTTVGRQLVRAGAAAIVMVDDAHRLPAVCETVVHVDSLGRISMTDPRRAEAGTPALGWGLERRVAADAARRLARLDDPELPVAGAGVPGQAPLLGLLGIDGDDPSEVEARWRLADGTARLASPLGADGEGPVLLDFVADGPHVLIGGTTGSGKSELLRSMVAGLAASADPAHVAMVLVDYKGGAAFDCCAELPHVVGVVTDLDADLAARALRCLEAELRHRERRLREVGADDMASFRERSSKVDEPLPRLVVVVDEFASMAADLPDFVESLVGIAQRGRSLGVHMVLATQRPAGVITDDIRANTSCRIALRVTDRNDSLDVIDAPDAASIPRDRPGRAVARFGPGELAPFHAAHVTGHSTGSAGVTVRVRGSAPTAASGPTDLERLVATVGRAHRARGGARPRPPWPPPLPHELWRDQHDAKHWFLVDDPDRQRQFFDGWDLGDGHLVVVGAPGAGASSTLAAAALAVSAGGGPHGAHVHVIDLDAGVLSAFEDLAAAGTIAGPADRVRRIRLLRWLDDEIARRRGESEGTADPPLLLVVDDLGGLARAHDMVREGAVHERFARIWSDGPSVGVTVAVSVRRAPDLPPALAATAGTVLLHRTADPSDAVRFGLKQSTELFPPGRAIRVRDGATLQVMRNADSIAAAVARRADEAPMPAPHDVGELAAEIAPSESAPSAELTRAGVTMSFAIRDRDLTPCPVSLHRGEHLLVLGPARSGRTAVLHAIASAAPGQIAVVGDELARRCGRAPTPVESVAAATTTGAPMLVLVDDALEVDDPSGELAGLVAAPPPGVHLVVAARPDRYRSAYGHWSADVKASRVGVLLRPDPLDGDLLGHQFPARLDLPAVAGRGVVIADGTAEVVQVVLSDDQSAS